MPSPTDLTNAAWRALVAMTIFNALSAIGGGVAMLLTAGLGMPRSLLENSPFSSFVIPALILVTVLGGTHGVAAVLLLVRRDAALMWSAISGLAMIIWILVETVMIQGFGALQALYFTAGIVEVVLVMLLLGLMPWLPRWPARAPIVRSG